MLIGRSSFAAAGLALVSLIAPGVGAAAESPGPGDAGARLVACRPAVEPAQRSMTVEGSMRALGVGEAMGIRFDLYRRLPGSPAWTRVPGPGLGTYHPATDGVGSFRYRKRIENLPAPSDYRVAATLRWLDSDGSTLATVVRGTPVCHQPELRAPAARLD